MKKNSIKQLTMHKAQLTIIAALIMLTAWACTNEDSEALSQAPVSITANVAGVVTRATGDIKTAFYPGDQITLTVGSIDYTATLQPDATWTTSPNLDLPTDGSVTTVEANTTGPDPLAATASTTDGNMNLTVDPTTGEPVWNITLNFTHTNAVVDVMVFDPQMNNITTQMQSITLAGFTSTTPNDILLAPTTLTAVTVRVNGIAYTANSTAALLANTRYTIAFICDPVKPTVTITENPTWGTGETGVAPIGYDYIISNLAELKAWNTAMQTTTNLGKRAIQTANITWDGTEWTPVGSSSVGNKFKGVYNGNGYTITGLRIGTNERHAGMFGNVYGAVLTGIHLRDAKRFDDTVNDGNKIGLLVGTAEKSSTISLCSVQGSLTADGWYMAGGLVGHNNNSHITRCYADVTITHTTNEEPHTGGLVGNSSGTIVACGASGNITTTNTNTIRPAYAGGLAGRNNGTIYYCYATGNVSINPAGTGSKYAGGLVGHNNGGNINYSYATGNATSPDATTGSLVGSNTNSYEGSTGIITSCHATGTATGGKFVGNMEDDDVKVSNAPGARRTTIAATGDIPPTVRTVQYTPATGYDALNVTSKEFAGADKTTGASLWTTGATPDINYLGYNGEQ